MENTHTRKGGPPRHLHRNQDEWFYVLRGEYIIEIGSQRSSLSEGDSILGPRQIPHAYAVLESLRSPESKRGYGHAIDEFIQWYCSEPRLSFNKVVVTRFRIALENRGLAA
ncbi:MAG: cupin domain-containing protein, partial [Deltaproteobacteria bacterium]